MKQIKWFNILVSRGCNLRCVFCNEYKYNLILDNTRVNDILNLLKNLYKDGYKIENLKFFGGEPLLNFSLIKKFVEEFDNKIGFKKRKGDFIKRFRITTNGLFLDNKKINFFNEKGIRVNISLNGTLNIFNNDRDISLPENKWNELLSNIKLIDKNNLFINFNVSPFCVENNFLENFKYVYNISKNINFLPIYFQNWTKKQLFLYLKGIEKIKKNYKYNVYWENYENFSYIPLHNRGININSDGKIYSSSMVLDIDENDFENFQYYLNKIYIGNLKNIDLSKVEKKINYSLNESNIKELMDKIYYKTKGYKSINSYLDKGLDFLLDLY